MADRVGQQLGNYRLVQLLGQGGFAEVYLGEHLHLGTQAAIKLLHTQLAGEDTNAFRNEARTIARLIHPHIVRVFDFGIEGETPFLVMDYAAAGTVRKRHPKGVALPLPTILTYIKQTTSALQYAHDEHYTHRDVKPENLLIGRHQEILLSDFGIALITQTSRSQSMQDVAGTASYMAPEQFQGKPRPASDQYALAVIVYEWLTGACPFLGSFMEIASQHLFVPPPPLKERMPGISPAVEQVVIKALAKDPHHRFGSVQAFATAFEQASQVETSQTLPASPSPYPADAMPPLHPAQTPTEPIISPDEPFIPTEPIIAPTELVTSPGQRSLPPPAFNEAAGPPTEPALPSQKTVPDSDTTGPSNGTVIKPSGNGRKHSLLSILPMLRLLRSSSLKINVWSIGKRQLVAMLVGTIIFGGLYYGLTVLLGNQSFTNALFNPIIPSIGGVFIDYFDLYGILYSLVFTIPLFFAVEFGPWVGLVIIEVCILFGIFLAIHSIALPWYVYLSNAIFVFISGLALLATKGRYNTTRAIAIAVGFSAVGIVISNIVGVIGDGITFHFALTNYLGEFFGLTLTNVVCLILLPILLLIYNAITRNTKFA
jgi:serine/threonine protein kinase